MKNWTTFKDAHPKLGQPIDLKIGDSEYLDKGRVEGLRILSPQWISIDTEYSVGIALMLDYQWRETLK